MTLVPFSRPHALGRRFAQACRDEGALRASNRALRFVMRRLTGRTPGTVGAYGRGGTTPGAPYLLGVWTDLARQGAFAAQNPVLGARPRIALIGDLNLPQCRKYRVDQAAAFWAAQGADLDYAHFGDVPRAVSILQGASHVILYRVTTGPEVTTCLYEARRLGLPVLYDIDDPLFSVPAYATYGNMDALGDDMRAHFIAQAPGYLDVMNACDAVSVSTPALADHARGFTSRPVHVRRNYADAATLEAGADQPSQKPGGLRLAFASGSQGHEADFARIRDPVERFLRGDRRRRLMVLGHFDRAQMPASLRPQVEWHRFTDYAGYLATLARADCVALPLSDDLFNRCKSAVRVIDAFAVSRPVIADPVGDAPALIDDGRTGFLAADPDVWVRALEQLGNAPERARAMGRTAREVLENRWAVKGRAAAHIADPDLVKWVMG